MDRPRLIKWIKWALSVFTAIWVLLMLLSIKVHLGASAGRVAVGVSRGAAFGILWKTPKPSSVDLEWLRADPRITYDWYWWFSREPGGQSMLVYIGPGAPVTVFSDPVVHIPLWAFALLAGAPAAWLWNNQHRATRRARAGLCLNCGYDRDGLVKDRACPECGSKS